ncbi:RidA family protein [Pseudooceanicola sediminis]|uniref:RidA family protein n=1 Tax=Pseudooceanicola sediminis TaxID=2211117 RepID=A0A399J690_9RHOB|nr:RidA family protein [Pseudooceanicola sediminis]KAA2314305.1 RidA family protein [Puniceibacterium sp. HSS470]RII39839.1 RidA family protein [Pseudooceanicola sediminis]|tara:strand:- start:24384 stop:24758 length:375 start_codon:yes stop_codon:yes gene_type:complete
MKAVTAPGVPDPVPGLFSNAIVADGIVYISGMHAGGPDPVPDAMLDQARIAIGRVVALARAAGNARITKITVYVTDMADRAAVAQARREAFADAPLPAATMLEVSGFVDPALKIEVEAIAHLPR